LVAVVITPGKKQARKSLTIRNADPTGASQNSTAAN